MRRASDIIYDSGIVVAAIIAGLLISVLVGCASEAQPAPAPTLLVFHASWCRWCPTDADMAALARRHPDVRVREIDIDEHPRVAEQYYITKVPTFVVPFGGDGPIGPSAHPGWYYTNSMTEAEQWLTDRGY